MKNEHLSVPEMWSDYLGTIGEDPQTTEKTYCSWQFCDNETDANELVDLVLKEIKQATTSLHLFYEIEGDPVPQPGDLSIVTDWEGVARCILRTTSVETCPFREVTEAFAAIEGEGDKSLRYWQEAHIRAFGRYLMELGMTFSEDLLVVCEIFEVAYR